MATDGDLHKEDGAADALHHEPSLPQWYPWGQIPTVARPSDSTGHRRSNLVSEALHRLVLSDGLRAGDALPSERTLSLVFNTARGSVRAALLELREQGILRIAHGQVTRVLGRPPCWAMTGGFDTEFGPDVSGWLADLRAARTAIAAASFDVEKRPSHRPMLESFIAALQMLKSQPHAPTIVLAVDLCHRRIVDLCPPALRDSLHGALCEMPAHLLRDAVDGGLCTDHLHMKLWILQSSWLDRNCDGTKAAVLDYMRCLEALGNDCAAGVA